MNTIFLAFSIKNSSVSEFFLEFANQMVSENRVVIISDSVEPHFFTVSPKIEIYNWPSKRPTHFRDFRFLFNLVKKYKPHTMISNFGAVNLFLTVGFLLGVKNRIAWYHTPTSALKKNKVLKLRKQVVYKMATRLIANSHVTKKDLMGNFGVKENKVQVIYNAVRNYQIEKEVERYKLVFVGRLDPIKGLDVLFAAMPIVIEKYPKIHLTVVGGDNTAKINKYQKLAEKLGIQDYVDFLGNQGKKEVLNQLSGAYAAVVPSFVEGFGYVVIESFSVKTPVIGSRTTAIAEIVREDKDGLLFEPGNHEDLAEKIILLSGDSNMRNTFGVNCFERFRNTFEINATIGNFIAALDEENQKHHE